MVGLRKVFALGCVAWAGVFCAIVVLPSLLTATAIPQLPFGQPQAAGWMVGIPPDSDHVDAPGAGVRALSSTVPFAGYAGGVLALPQGLPLVGPIRHKGEEKAQPVLGCEFADPTYLNHTGVDFPVESGTPVHATMAGRVVFAGWNGPWGNLVVVENHGYQTWFAHNESIGVTEGTSVAAGDVVASSGSTGNSTGPHVHYGIKRFGADPDPDDGRTPTADWLNPTGFFSLDDVTVGGCW